MIFRLHNRDGLAADAKVSSEGSDFKVITLAYNTRCRKDVDTVLAETVKASGKLVKAAEDVF